MPRPIDFFMREGATAGFLGAGVVALWFLILDLLAGRPLATPSILGQVILFGIAAPTPEPLTWAVVAYTLLHFGLFVVLGIVTAKMVHLALREGIWRFALLMLFVVFEVFFYGLVEMGLTATRGFFPFWSILSANTLAAAAMGLYFYRRHPELKAAYQSEPLGS